jgi:hypothetical protein
VTNLANFMDKPIRNVGALTNNTDAATKKYVDDVHQVPFRGFTQSRATSDVGTATNLSMSLNAQRLAGTLCGTHL